MRPLPEAGACATPVPGAWRAGCLDVSVCGGPGPSKLIGAQGVAWGAWGRESRGRERRQEARLLYGRSELERRGEREGHNRFSWGANRESKKTDEFPFPRALFICSHIVWEYNVM